MENLLNAIWSIMELVFFHFFWDSFLSCRQTKKRYVVAIAFVWVLGIVYMAFISNQIVKQTLTYLMLSLVSLYLYHGIWYQHIIFVVLGCMINGLVDTLMIYGASAILGVSYAEFSWMKLFYAVTVSTSKLIAILLAWTIWRIRRTIRGHAIQHKWLLLALLFPAVSFVMLAVVFVSFQDEQDLSAGAVIFSAFLAAANVAIIYLIGAMEKSTRESQENILMHQQMDIQADSILALERSYRSQRQVTHEYRNQLQTIFDLLVSENVSEAKDYIQQLQGLQTMLV